MISKEIAKVRDPKIDSKSRKIVENLNQNMQQRHQQYQDKKEQKKKELMNQLKPNFAP